MLGLWGQDISGGGVSGTVSATEKYKADAASGAQRYVADQQRLAQMLETQTGWTTKANINWDTLRSTSSLQRTLAKREAAARLAQIVAQNTGQLNVARVHSPAAEEAAKEKFLLALTGAKESWFDKMLPFLGITNQPGGTLVDALKGIGGGLGLGGGGQLPWTGGGISPEGSGGGLFGGPMPNLWAPPPGQSTGINAGPVWRPADIQGKVNQMNARGAQATESNLQNTAGSLAGRGMGSGGPLMEALKSQALSQNLASSLENEGNLRWNAAQGNAQQQLAGQTAQSKEAIERAQIAAGTYGQQLQSATGITQSMIGARSQLGTALLNSLGGFGNFGG